MSHDVVVRNPVHGMVAEFTDPDQLIAASHKAYEQGYRKLDAYTPFAVHGLHEAIGFHETKVPWMIFIAGAVGAATGFALESWVSVVAYPHNVGGRPLLSWPSFIPVIFECTVLFAGVTAVIGTLAINGLPKPHQPIFNTPNFERATRDRFFLSIEAEDPMYDHESTKKFMEALGAASVTEVMRDPDDED